MHASPANAPKGVCLTLDLVERTVLALLYGAMTWTFLRSWQETGDLVSLILLATEGSVVILTLIRRWTCDISLRPVDWLVALAGTTAPLLVRPTGGEALVPAFICLMLTLGGFTLQIAAKLTLRRSFGLIAANRGVKVGGPYRLVRHPMYAGYLLAHIGFLLTNPSAWNAAVYSVGFALQIRRILAEERVLIRDKSYQDFVVEVPYRLAPRIF